MGKILKESKTIASKLVEKLPAQSEEIIFGAEKTRVIPEEAVPKMVKEYFLKSNNGLNSRERAALLEAQYEATINMMMNIGRYTKGMAVESLKTDFQLKKMRLIEEMQNVCTPGQLKRIKSAKTPEEMTYVLFTEETSSWNKLIKLKSRLPKGKVLLEQEQIDYALRIKRGQFIIAREKAIATPAQNPYVIKVENILKEKYGVEYVNLKDDEEIAENVLRAFETVSKCGDPLPKQVIVSDFMMVNGERIDPENAILLASKKAVEVQQQLEQKLFEELPKATKEALARCCYLPNKNIFATSATEHIPVHEIMHGKHPIINAYAEKKIPKELIPVKEELSLYSAISKTHETFTELSTKRAIQGLNEQETELYNYLNFYG